VSLVHLNNRSKSLINEIVGSNRVSGEIRVGGELMSITEGADAPYVLKIKSLVGKDPSDVKSWKVHFVARALYPHLCPLSAIGVLFLKVFGTIEGEIDFTNRKSYWDLGLLPSFGKNQLSHHVQRQDILALVNLLGIHSLKVTHGFRYAAERMLIAMNVPQPEIDKLLGWSSKISTGGVVYAADCPSGICC